VPGLNLLINALQLSQEKSQAHSASTTSVSGGAASLNQVSSIPTQTLQSLHSAPSDINSVLVYNIAAISYQT
jgi:hypothetical protein